MDAARAIEEAVARRRWHPIVGERLARLLDGREDRTRLRCCGSGCAVCVRELQLALREVEEAAGLAPP